MHFDLATAIWTLLNLLIPIAVIYGVIKTISYFKNLSRRLKAIEDKLDEKL